MRTVLAMIILMLATFMGPSASADPNPDDSVAPIYSPFLSTLTRFDNSGADNVFTACGQNETKIFEVTSKLKPNVDARFGLLRKNRAHLRLKNGSWLTARARAVDDTKRAVVFRLFDVDLRPDVRPDKRGGGGVALIFKGSVELGDFSISRVSKRCVLFN